MKELIKLLIENEFNKTKKSKLTEVNETFL